MQSESIEKAQFPKVGLILHKAQEPSETVQIIVKCNGQTYFIKVSRKIPIFSITKIIEIEGSHQRLIKLLSSDTQDKLLLKESKHIELEQQYQVEDALTLINNATNLFGRQIQINLTDLAINYFLSHENKANSNTSIIDETSCFDALPFESVMKIYKYGYDLLSNKLRHRVGRMMKKYLNETKRSKKEQNMLTNLHRIMKNLNQNQEIAEGNKLQNNSGRNREGAKNTEDEWVSSDQSDTPNNENITKNDKIKRPTTRNTHKQHKQHMNKRGNRKSQTDSSATQNWSIEKKKQQGLTTHQKVIEAESDDELSEEGNGKKQKVEKYKQKRYPYRNKDNVRGSYSRERRPYVDFRISLGLRGDTDAGWRERIRPKKIAIEIANETKNENNSQRYPISNQGYERKKEKYTEKLSRPNQSNQKRNRKNTERPPAHNQGNQGKMQLSPKDKATKSQQLAKQGQATHANLTKVKVFQYPEERNKKFTFKQNVVYNIFVNELFWINVEPDKCLVTIVHPKQNKGFLRPGKPQLINEGKGFMTQGLTFGFEMVCNFEDGGDSWGGATIQDFLPNGKQWFTLASAQVYARE